MSIDAPPPAQPPQMSPDGKWIWDGAQWRPIPVHEAAFPNWKGVGAGFVPEADTGAPVATFAPPTARGAAPAPSYRMASPAPGLAAPQWGNKSRSAAGIKRYAYLGVAAAGLVVVIVLVSVVGTLVVTNRPSDVPATTANVPAGGPTARSENAQAAYLVKSLQAHMTDLPDNITLSRRSCAGGMTSACEDTLITIGNTVQPMLPVIDGATVPACLAATVAPFRADLGKIEEGQQLALKGYQDNKYSEWLNGYAEAQAYGLRAPVNFNAVKTASVSCDSALTGP